LAGVVACTVSVNDDSAIDDIGDGASGGTSVSGSGGSSGSSAGSSSGGSAAGQGGAAGSMSMVENGGSAGSSSIPTPVCTTEAGDAQDPCLTCIKQQCCTQWQGCNDVGCQTEREDTLTCVSMLDMSSVDADTFGDCLTASTYDGSDFAQANTNALFDCINEESTDPDAGGGTRCGVQCFGTDIFF
jgi:hypothetical protein